MLFISTSGQFVIVGDVDNTLLRQLWRTEWINPSPIFPYQGSEESVSTAFWQRSIFQKLDLPHKPEAARSPQVYSQEITNWFARPQMDF